MAKWQTQGSFKEIIYQKREGGLAKISIKSPTLP